MVEPQPVEIRRGGHRLRADTRGLFIGHGRRNETWPWESVVALGVDHPPSYLMVFFARGLATWFNYLRRPCLQVCLRGDARPHLALAVRFPRRTDLRAGRHAERELAFLREMLDGWLERTSTEGVGQPDLGVWWYAQREAHPALAKPPARPPSTQERAAEVGRDLERLRDELDHFRREH
ncbi:MAG: hypothetical protein QOD38_936 [Acidimicrobiaceae bacterium]|jgi:hypothetical protein